MNHDGKEEEEDTLGVRPEEVAHGPVVRDLLLPVDGPDLVEGVDGGGQTTMDTEDLVVDDGRQAEVVENFATFFRKKKKEKRKSQSHDSRRHKERGERMICSPVSPDVHGVVLPEALIVEAVDLGDLPALVVAPDEGNAVGEPDLQGQEEQEGLHAVETAINKVTHEQVVGLGALSTHIEELNQVVELAMNISTNLVTFTHKHNTHNENMHMDNREKRTGWVPRDGEEEEEEKERIDSR